MAITEENSATPISSFFLKTWGILYAYAVIFFVPFLCHFIWGNHDWQWVKETTPLTSGLFEGRFSQFILQNLLFCGQILPVLTTLAALGVYTFGAILLFKLWNIPPQKVFYVLLGLNLVCAPYTLSWLYFAFLTLSCLSWVCVVIAAFYLLQTKKNIWAFLSASLLFMLALGGYPPTVNLIGVIFFTLILNDISLNARPAKNVLKKYLPHTFAVILGIALFLFIQYLLKKYQLQYGTYNTAEIKVTELFPKLLLSLKQAFNQFFTTTSFITYSYKYINFCLVLLALFKLWHHLPKQLLSITLFFGAVTGLLFSTVLTFFAAQNTGYVANAPRIEFFGLIYIYIFSAAVLLKSNTLFIRNIMVSALIFLAFYNLTTLAYAQKIWHLAFQAETSFSTRIIRRIEDNPAFSLNNKYTLVQSDTLKFRNRFYVKNGNEALDSYTLDAPYIPWHLPSNAYHFYYPENFIKNDFDIFWMFATSNDIPLTASVTDYINKNAQIWPDKNAVYFNDDLIILTITPECRNRARDWLKKQENLSS